MEYRLLQKNGKIPNRIRNDNTYAPAKSRSRKDHKLVMPFPDGFFPEECQECEEDKVSDHPWS